MDNISKNAPEIRQAENKKILIAQLAKLPIVESACQKAGIGRASYYRWRSEDTEFRKAADEAIAEGESFITDMSESQLITLIRDRNFPAIQLWLRHHHPKYGNKIEINGNLHHSNEELSPEQEALVREAIELASFRIDENHESKKI